MRHQWTSASDATVTQNQAVDVSTLFSVSDSENDTITQYQLYDGGTGGGYFELNGTPASRESKH